MISKEDFINTIKTTIINNNFIIYYDIDYIQFNDRINSLILSSKQIKEYYNVNYDINIDYFKLFINTVLSNYNIVIYDNDCNKITLLSDIYYYINKHS